MTEIKYDPEMCEIVLQIMENGGLIEDVLKLLKIDQKILDNWRYSFPEFNQAIETGLTFSQAWWQIDIRENLCNPSYDTEKAMNVMVKNFGWSFE